MPSETCRGRVKSKIVVKSRHGNAEQCIDDADQNVQNENDNNCGSAVGDSRKRHLTEPQQSKRGKKKSKTSDDEELDYEDVQTAQFEEDSNVVEIAVQKGDDQFMSEDEDEVDSEESETEEGELSDAPDMHDHVDPDTRVVKRKQSR